MATTCPICTKPVDQPWRLYAEDGTIDAGCTSAHHDAHADEWHMRPGAIAHRWTVAKAEADSRFADGLEVYGEYGFSDDETRRGTHLYADVKRVYVIATQVATQPGRDADLHDWTATLHVALRRLHAHESPLVQRYLDNAYAALKNA